MNAKNISQITFLAIVLACVILSVFIVKPFATYIVLSLALAYLFYPAHTWLAKRIKNETAAAFILVIALIVILIIPAIFIIAKLAPQASLALTQFSQNNVIENLEKPLEAVLGHTIQLEQPISEATSRLKGYVLENIGGFLTSATDILVGLFVMFFTLFYALKHGPKVVDRVAMLAPLKQRHRDGIIAEIKRVTHAVIKGQVAIALLQGILGGLGFWALGISNPVFWGFVMMILSLLPVIGPPIVWAPAAIILILEGSTLRGVLLLVYGFFIISGIDNVLKPRIVASEGKIHPVLALIGVFGGLKVFGLLGIIVGPLILAITIALLKFLNEETREKNSTHRTRQRKRITSNN